MSIIKEFKLFQVVLGILVCLVFLTTLPSNSYCDDWVYVTKTDNELVYYDKSTIEIDRNSKQIKVWLKWKYTEKGKENEIKLRQKYNLDVTDYHNLDYDLRLISIDYNNLMYRSIVYEMYDKSGEVLDSSESFEVKWKNILPGTLLGQTLTKILKDYNIQR